MPDNVLQTDFTAWFLDLPKMRREGNKIAKDLGMEGGNIDSFRHAYVSAKMADIWSGVGESSAEAIARIMGLSNEVGGINNTLQDHVTDLGNNEWGLAIRAGVDREVEEMLRRNEITKAERENVREWLLRVRIAQAVRDGRLTQTPFEATRNPVDKARQKDADEAVKQRLRGYLRDSRKQGFYIWRTREDDKVRKEHALRDGCVFAWNAPPEDGHPGETYNCRCVAEPLKV